MPAPPRRVGGRSPVATGCLVVAIVFAVGIGSITVLGAIIVAAGGVWWGPIVLAAGPLGLGYLFFFRRRGRRRPRRGDYYPALAITVIAIATFLLLLGVCSQMSFDMH